MKRLIAVLGICLLAGPVMAQLVTVSGYVYQKDAPIVIPFTNFINKKNRNGAVSDINGFYTMVVAPGDTVEITAIGFEKLKLSLPDGFEGANLTYNVYLKKNIVDLKTVTVGLMNYERFKQEFEAMKLPEQRKMVVGDPTVYKNYVAPKENFGYTFKGPFTALYNKFNKKARELEKLQALMENDNKQMVASMKLTRDLVNQVTGLEKDEEIDSFLRYCNMSNEFLANSTRYDIMVAIDRCYDQYVKDTGISPHPNNNSVDSLLQKEQPR